MDTSDFNDVFVVALGIVAVLITITVITLTVCVYRYETARNEAKLECVRITQKPSECLALFQK